MAIIIYVGSSHCEESNNEKAINKLNLFVYDAATLICFEKI